MAQPYDLPKTRQPCGIVIQPAGRAAAFPIVARPPVLVTIDADGVRRLFSLPRLDSRAPAYLGQEKVKRLLERLSTVPLREQEELSNPGNNARLVSGKRQVLFSQELAVSIQHSLEAVFARRHNSVP